jgi:8-oxo-dGTP pyrophosphatase MutT (NUDIX family)
MHHRKLDRWLQPGGHADGDTDLLYVASREAREESGIKRITAVFKRLLTRHSHTMDLRIALTT